MDSVHSILSVCTPYTSHILPVYSPYAPSYLIVSSVNGSESRCFPEQITWVQKKMFPILENQKTSGSSLDVIQIHAEFFDDQSDWDKNRIIVFECIKHRETAENQYKIILEKGEWTTFFWHDICFGASYDAFSFMKTSFGW